MTRRKGSAGRAGSGRTGRGDARPGSGERGPGARIGLEWWLAGAILIMVQAGILAALFTPAPHPGGDNAGYLTLGYALSQGLGYIELWAPGGPAHTKYPPAFPALLALMIAAGAATWGTFKVLTATLISLASILVFVWVAARRGPTAGLTVALLTLVSAGWLEASRWILSEPLFLVFVFLTLWAGDQAGLGSRGPVDKPDGTEVPARRAPWGGWLWIAAAGSILAVFTRSAGLPVVLALISALLFARHWRGAAVLGGISALAGGFWAWRSRADADGAYQSEFWMVNPYDPSLGTVGIPGLLGRVWTNLVHYTTEVIPGEWWGDAGVLLPILGVALAGLALVGWGRGIAARSPGVAGLFLPLYAGLILLWPEVWAGDRFVLPLYPLLLLYAGEEMFRIGEALRTRVAHRGTGGGAGRSVGWQRWISPGLVAGAALLLLVPAIPTVVDKAENASLCREVGAVDPFRCLGRGMMEFRDAAGWAGENLPEGAIVLNRKPRIFRALGGTAGWTYPFTRDPEAFLAEADARGARYLLLDQVDGVSVAYLPPLIERAPGAFCWITGWGDVTDLLGILPPAERGGDDVFPCPPGYAPPDAGERPEEPGVGRRDRIPILAR